MSRSKSRLSAKAFLLKELVWRDVRSRYVGSGLGLAWAFANPILWMVLYTAVFAGVLRVPIPALTEERRKELSRHVHKQAEDGRNVVRQARRDANERLKKLLKDHKISEDDERKGLDQVQKITDDHVKLIDDLQKKKDQELLGH